MSDRDYLGHEWFIGPGGFTCARCAKPRLDGEEQYPCWPPCADCAKPIVDHNDDPDDPHGKRPAQDFCWQRSTADGKCPAPTIDWRARALKAEAAILDQHIANTTTRVTPAGVRDVEFEAEATKLQLPQG